MVKPALLVATVVAFAQAPAPPPAQGQAPGTTPTQCVLDLRTFTTQRQTEMRAALPPLSQPPTDDELRVYQAKLSQLNAELTQKRLALATECPSRRGAEPDRPAFRGRTTRARRGRHGTGARLEEPSGD